MRCIHLLDTDGFAGTERYLLVLVQHLRTSGIDAIIGCRGGGALQKMAAAQQLPTIDLGPRPGPRMLRNLLRHLRDHRPDLIHAHNGRTQLMGAIANRLTGVPLFATQHFLQPQFVTYRGPKRLLADMAHAWVNRRVRKFAAVSEAARVAMLKREHIQPDKIVTIPNGIDPMTVPSLDRLQQLRVELGVETGAPMVVTVARLTPEKGVADLIQCIATVRRHIPQVVFVMVGEGPLRASLMELATRLAVMEAIRFAGFRSDAVDVIAAGDLFVLPSRVESFGLVLLEAMALAKPVIAVAAGGPLEIVVDNRTGRLVPPGDQSAMVDAIVQLLSDSKLSEMGFAGLRRFEQNFTAERMATATNAMYAAAAV